MKFQSKGEKPIWQMIYDHVVNLPIETVISFDDLSNLIGEDFKNQRSSIYKARKVLAKEHKRYLVSFRGTGYKIVVGNDMLRHAEGRHDKANKQIKLANFEALNINTQTMSGEEKMRWSSFLAWNGNVMAALSANTEKIARANIVAVAASSNVMEQLHELKDQLDSYSKQMDDIGKQLKS